MITMFAKRNTIFINVVPYSCELTWRTHVLMRAYMAEYINITMIIIILLESIYSVAKHTNNQSMMITAYLRLNICRLGQVLLSQLFQNTWIQATYLAESLHGFARIAAPSKRQQAPPDCSLQCSR